MICLVIINSLYYRFASLRKANKSLMPDIFANPVGQIPRNRNQSEDDD